LHYSEQPLTEYTTLYDFFFMLDRARKRADKERKYLNEWKMKNRARK
jgi:hypothetical protein